MKDVLSPADYERWTVLKAKYIGRDNGVERKRPMLAAQELNKRAMEKLGLVGNNMVWDKVEATAKKDHVRIVEPKAAFRSTIPASSSAISKPPPATSTRNACVPRCRVSRTTCT